MSTYRENQGYRIKKVDTDPANPKEGQIWYNNISKQIKVRILVPAAWASGGNLNSGRAGLGGAGIQTAALAFGGSTPSLNETEEYNGSSWSEQNNLNTGRFYGAGFGIQTAAVMAGGLVNTTDNRNLNSSEEYNGTSWSEGNNLNTGRDILSGAGTQTAGLCFGG